MAETVKSRLIENDLLNLNANKELQPEFAAGLRQAIQQHFSSRSEKT